jgi:hypothetical protein
VISGLPLDYSYARAAGRLAQRPDERLWLQLRSARGVASVLEAVRASAAASTVSGIALTGDADAIELAFRQQFRTRVEEVAAWSPDPWRPAVLYTRHLIDLPALLHLLRDEAPPRWIAVDPALAGYAHASRASRRNALAAGPLHAIASALDNAADQKVARTTERAAALHPALSSWEAQWRALWPSSDDNTIARLDELAHLLRRHVIHFGLLAVDETLAARQSLATRLLALLHRATAQPAALFAYLALFAVDLERLRSEFVVRARLGAAT